MVSRRSIAELAESETTPLADKLRKLGIACTASGNIERGKGLVQAADVVDEDLRALTGRALVEALDRMLERRLDAFVADVVAAVRDTQAEAPAAPAPAPPRLRRKPIPLSVAPALPHLTVSPVFDPTIASRAPAKGLRRVLVAVAQHMPQGVDKHQLSILTGYKRTTRDLYVQQAVRAGWLVVERGHVRATDEGLRELGPGFEPLPTGDRLRAHWLANLPEGERRVLAFVVGFYPHPVSRDRIGEACGYRRTTRDLYLQKLARRKLVEATGRGHFAASGVLFDPQPRSKGTGT